jgi:hypothetical protein
MHYQYKQQRWHCACKVSLLELALTQRCTDVYLYRGVLQLLLLMPIHSLTLSGCSDINLGTW